MTGTLFRQPLQRILCDAHHCGILAQQAMRVGVEAGKGDLDFSVIGQR